MIRQAFRRRSSETLPRSADYEVYVRDRSPRCASPDAPSPRTGQEGIPVVSVNTSRVGVEIYRIGDRSLAPTVRSDEFLSRAQRLFRAPDREREGRPGSGRGASTPPDLNQDVVTAFPVLGAVGTLQPGVYVMMARPQNGGAPADDEDYETRATQWFIVSDLGLTALKGADGVHVLVRSLASAEPVRSVEIGSSPATTRSSRRRRRTSWAMRPSIPALPAAKAVSRRASSSRRRARITAFSISTLRLRSDRPRREGPAAAGAVDAFVFTERGVYRTGETVFATALLRDANGAAIAGVPLTLVVRRPTASNTAAPWWKTRVSVDARCRSRSCPAPCAEPGASPPIRIRRAPPSAKRASSSRITSPSAWR